MDNAVTIIVGAGAVLDFDHRGIIPTVNNITEEVLKCVSHIALVGTMSICIGNHSLCSER